MAWVVSIFVLALVLFAPRASIAQDIYCGDDADSLLCRLVPALEAALAEPTPEAEMLFPRLRLANGDLADAMEGFARLERWSYDPDKFEQFSNVLSNHMINPYGTLNIWTSPLLADPVIAITGDDPQPVRFEDMAIWEQFALARAQAASGEADAARTTFRAIAELETWSLRSASKLSILYTIWSATGFADDAMAHADGLVPLRRAWAYLGIADGLAMRGDLAATIDAVAELPSDLRTLGGMATAEAHRRNGDSATAMRMLLTTQEAMEGMAAGLRTNAIRWRLARGLALLGNRSAVQDVLGERHDGLSGWHEVAPLLACHDLRQTLEMFDAAADQGGRIPYLPLFVRADILVAAAASGQAEDAFAYALAAKDKDTGPLLLAVLIGLTQASHLPDNAPECATLNVIPR